MNSALKNFVINHWLKPVAWAISEHPHLRACKFRASVYNLARGRKVSWLEVMVGSQFLPKE